MFIFGICAIIPSKASFVNEIWQLPGRIRTFRRNDKNNFFLPDDFSFILITAIVSTFFEKANFFRRIKRKNKLQV